MVNYIHNGLRTKLILPFAVPAKDRAKPVTKNMKIAAIFYLAESNRKKSEGHILKKIDEKLIFIAEARYPIWLVQRGGATLLFDGLGVSSHTFSYDIIPSVQAFNKDIQRNAKTWKNYSTALSRNTNNFKNFIGKEEKTIDGLITSTEFIQDFSLYSSSVEKTEKPVAAKVVLSPIFNKTEISASIKDLANLEKRINKDIKNLEASMKLLSTKTRDKVKEIPKEIQKIRKKFDEKIEKVKPRVTKKIRQNQDKHDKKIKDISKRFERKIQHLHKDQVKVEKTEKRLKSEIKRCEIKIRSYKSRKNKRNLKQWTLKLEKYRKKLPIVKKKSKKIETRIENLETARNFEISKMKTECNIRIEESKKILRELEASREAGIRIIKPKITEIEKNSSLIMNQINEMVMSKKASLTNFDRITMTKKRRGLVYLPFYIVRYNLDSKKRYDIYPPSIVSGMGISAKLKGVFGVKKMKCFLQPRSTAITEFLNQLITLIQKNPMLEKELTEAGIQASALRTKKLRIGVKRGLKELKKEKWISKNELQILSKLLYLYTPSLHSHKRIKIKLKAPAQV
jgi:hypothetical protein